MRRREFVAALGTTATWPLVAIERGDHRMRSGKPETGRDRRIAVDQFTTLDNGILFRRHRVPADCCAATKERRTSPQPGADAIALLRLPNREGPEIALDRKRSRHP